MGHQREGQLVFTRHPPALPGHHRLVSESAPAALALDPTQQRRMRLQALPTGTLPLEAKADDSGGPGGTGRFPMARAFGQQGHKQRC